MSEPDAQDVNLETRYDRMAEGYACHWAPVIREAAVAILDLVDPGVGRGATVLDVGTGTGTLAFAALARWPSARVTGIDASSGMLEIAGDEAGRQLDHRTRRRFRTEVALADRLPFDDGSFDIAVSSFVLQLVPSRAAALREMRRVLRPGGTIAWVTWLAGESRFRGDEVANEVFEEFGFDPPEPDPRSGDLASVAAAATTTRRAGFDRVRATGGSVIHRWTAAGYLAFLTQFDEESLFTDLEADERRRLERRLLERFKRLSPRELTLRLPVVYVSGRART